MSWHGDTTREREFVTLLARADDDAGTVERARELLGTPLDWNWIVVTMTRHKTVQLAWHNMRRHDLIAPALGTGGLPELWTVYLSQLYTAGLERNRVWLENAANLSAALQEAGVRLVVIKGGALIGDIYGFENRFLNDIDFIAERAELETIKKLMFDLGYQYGSFNFATSRIDPIDPRVERAWLFNNHVLPNFYRLTGHDTVPFYKIQVGFDFFDPFEDFSADGAAVVDRAGPKQDGSTLLVPSPIDTLVNLCCHIYREGVSMVYDDYNVNWQLTKFCDVLSFLLAHDGDLDIDQFTTHVDSEGIRRPIFYGLHYSNEVYRHPILTRWLEATDPGDRDYLDELTDGSRRVTAPEPFQERLFSLRGVRADFNAGWNKQFRRNEW